MKNIPLIGIALLLAVLSAAPAQAAGRILGTFKDGVYTNHEKLFTVQSPFPEEPTILDGRDPENDGAGAVSFIDDFGRLLGILYMKNRDPRNDASADAAVAQEMLRDWYRDKGFPSLFKVSLPKARILREEPGQILGKPAWIAVAYLPGGSPLGLRVHGEDELVHGDSWRGMAVVTQGERFYLLMTELRVEALATKDWTYDPQADDWNAFLPQLENLYSRITFR
jgi:hypothetical protein